MMNNLTTLRVHPDSQQAVAALLARPLNDPARIEIAGSLLLTAALDALSALDDAARELAAAASGDEEIPTETLIGRARASLRAAVQCVHGNP